ncbi:MAG TPA: UDP-N-acetylmuramate dehydrogenase [Candidatus Saccharimonadales bacterium]|nr:UDP-N-acetylmuramate dehydrogenase [Candidatus Saccharimonadales bacterium]
MNVRENVALAAYTTLGVGGPARWLAEAATEEEVREALSFAALHELPLLVLGGGSNVLVADSGFPGVVLRVALRGVRTTTEGPVEVLEAGAGESWDEFVALCVRGGLGGLECLSGIPGTVGGTPVQNVGAYGQEVAAVLRCVRVLDRATGEARTLTRYECGFGYRASVFNTAARDRYVVLRVAFALPRDAAPHLQYRDVREYFAARSGPAAGPPTLAEAREAVLAIRRRKAMLLEPGDPDSRSAGSFFKNPVVSAADCARIESAAGPGLPRYAVNGTTSEAPAGAHGTAPAAGAPTPSAPSPSLFKLPAAWLIERSGFARGHTRGRAGISSKHALAIVNRGGATAAEILELAREIRGGVEAKFGVRLEPEPILVGCEL